jgi:hypothetical protein
MGNCRNDDSLPIFPIFPVLKAVPTGYVKALGALLADPEKTKQWVAGLGETFADAARWHRPDALAARCGRSLSARQRCGRF